MVKEITGNPYSNVCDRERWKTEFGKGRYGYTNHPAATNNFVRRKLLVYAFAENVIPSKHP
jgi:hypothetical protein